MRQIIFDFGRLHLLDWQFMLRVYGYGLMLVLGFLVAIYVGQWRARRMGENPEHVARIGLLSLVGGILLAPVLILTVMPAMIELFSNRRTVDQSGGAKPTAAPKKK